MNVKTPNSNFEDWIPDQVRNDSLCVALKHLALI